MNFVLTGAGSSWLPRGVAQDGMLILLTQPGGWLLYKELNCGECTLRLYTTSQVCDDEVVGTGFGRIMALNIFSGIIFPAL